MKFLLIVGALVVLVAWVLARQSRRKVPPPAAEPSQRNSNAKPNPAKMLACARCGVHLPTQEAMFDDGGRAFCGPEHRLAGPG